MAKKGEKYKCGECGPVVVVDDACGCSSCDLICCGEPMKPMKVAKAKPKAKN
jgi:Desulfoferrodoxin, N-terminal domain